MLRSTCLLGVALLALQDGPTPALLTVGERLEGVLTQQAPAVHTPTLDAGYTDAPVVGVEYRFRVDELGAYHVDLRSYDFDAYLVLRGESGELIGEDDDGLLSTHARIVAELEPDTEYRVTACALHGASGSFRLELAPGVPAALSPLQRTRLELDDTRARLDHAERLHGPDHLETASRLSDLVYSLYAMGAFAEAKPLCERALAIREAQLGPDHLETAIGLSDLAVVLQELGALEEAKRLYERALGIIEKQLGPDDLETVETLGNLATLLDAMGEYAEAKRMHERVLAIRERTLGPDHPDTVSGLSNLANLLHATGEHEEARRLYERALRIREARLGPDHPLTASSLNGLAVVLSSMGAYEEAKPLLERALAISEKQQGPDHPDTAWKLNNLAGLLRLMGAYEEARPLLERALAICEKQRGPDHLDTAMALSSLASLLGSTGAYAEAKPLYERALAIRKAQLGPDHPDTASNLGDLALILESLGDYDEARSLNERALALLEVQLGPDHPKTSATLNNLASLLSNLGLFEQAKPLYERALAIHEARFGPDHPATATSVNNLARLLQSMGAFEEAQALNLRALAIWEERLGPDHPTVATSLDNLAVVLSTMGDFEEAKPLYERALAIREGQLGPDHPDTATSLDNLAYLLARMGDYEQAEPLLERSQAIREARFGHEHPSVTNGLHNLAYLLAAMGAYEEAKPLYEHALALSQAQLGPDHPDTARSLNNLALLLVDLGESERAFELVREHRAQLRGRLTRILAARTREEGRRYLSTLFWQQELELSFPRFLRTSDTERSAARGLLAWKGQVGRTERAARKLSTESPESLELFDRLQSLNRELARLAFDADSSNEARAHRLEAVRGEIVELEVTLREGLESDTLAETSVEALLARLPEKAALLSFFVHRIRRPARYEDEQLVEPGDWSEPHLVAWILRPSAEVVSVDLGLADVLETQTTAFLADLVESRGMALTREGDDPAGLLRESIWDPLAPHLADVSLVIVSHDQFTATLPFEVLRGGDGRYLVEDRSFAYLHDLQAIGGFEAEPRREFRSLFCVGGVDFNGREESVDAGLLAKAETRGDSGAPSERWQFWRSLDRTAAEAGTIRDLHQAFVSGGTESFLSGSDATEERVLEGLSEASIVHLATHGYFQPAGLPSMWAAALEERERQPDFGGAQPPGGLTESDRELTGYLPEVLSGLVFAGANLPPEEGRLDGYLTAADVDWLDLSGVELITLSACETGLGRSESGEGMSGFRTTLLRAGAKTVVSSLWQVPDDSTERLMTRFYENLLRNKMGKLEALREAQLWMLRENRRKYDGDGRPYSWGAFVLSGDWR